MKTSEEAVSTLRGGSALRYSLWLKVMMDLFIVSRIMLAKATIIVIMIPKEINPPVKVLY